MDKDDAKKMAHMFNFALCESYRMGKRMRQNCPFLIKTIRKYKQKSREELNEHSHSSPSSLLYPSHTVVKQYNIGSDMYKFFSSWPHSVCLKSAERFVKWSIAIPAKQCPFCYPEELASTRAICDTLQDLIDHLDSFHPDFTYEVKREHDSSATILIRIREVRETNVDPMYIYGGEGYLLSERFRKKHPNYVHARTRKGTLGYPFILNRVEVPKEYGGFIPNAPGTIDVVPHWSMGELDNQTLLNSFLSEKHSEEVKLNGHINQNTPLSTKISATLPYTSSSGDCACGKQSKYEKPAEIVLEPNQVAIAKRSANSSTVQSIVCASSAPSGGEFEPKANCESSNNNLETPEVTQRTGAESWVKDFVSKFAHAPSGGEIGMSVSLSADNNRSTVPVTTLQTGGTSFVKGATNEIPPAIKRKQVVNNSGFMAIDERAKHLGVTVERAGPHTNCGSVSNGVVQVGNEVQHERQQQQQQQQRQHKQWQTQQLKQQQSMSNNEKEPLMNSLPSKARKQSRVDCSSRRKTALPAPLQKSKVIKTAATMGTKVRKRTYYADPKGMENQHTTHFRSVMFGNKAYKKDAGKGVQPIVNEEAAKGRLFHTVTNIPLDIVTYNEGIDSDLEDGGEEVRWRCKCGDERLGEVVDMLAIEKYFFSLWNQFVHANYVSLGDRDVYNAYLRFVGLFGCEIKRMKMEVIFVKQLTRNYELGTLDADGYVEILTAFRNVDMKHVAHGVPHSEFDLPHEILRDSTSSPFRKKQYNGTSENEGGRKPPAVERWLDEQHRKVAEMERRVNPALKRGMASLKGWFTEIDVNEAAMVD